MPSDAIHGLSRSEFVGLISLTTATIAISIDTILPAFDEIEDAFSLADGRVSLSLTVFLAAMGIGNLFWGPLADRWGRLPVLRVSLALFIVGALISSFAGSFTIFLLGRMVWGLASAGPRVIAVAIVRDCYEGDPMARIMALTAAVFLVVPILAPGVGEIVLQFGSWRLTPVVAVVLAVAVLLWLLRLPETLSPENVIPLRLEPLARAAKIVVTSRTAVLFTLATTFAYAAFFPWLGSSPQIIDEIYGRAGRFALLFGLNAIFMGIAIVTSERLVSRFSTRPVALGGMVATLVTAIAYVAVAVREDGVPSFWVWFALATVLTMLNAATSPLLNTLAMEPLGEVAGMASSITGAVIFIASAALGALVDAQIIDTVTPFGVSFIIFTALALVALLAERRQGVAT